MHVVSQAVLASSSQNRHPWTETLDRADPAVLLLNADAPRLTPAVDPLGRQTVISRGAFLEVAVHE